MLSEVMWELTSRKRPSFQERWCGINLQTVEAHRFDRQPELKPVFQATRQRAHSPNAGLPELQCRTGTRGFVGSSAIENDLMLRRDIV
jgi:hypothetical protein